MYTHICVASQRYTRVLRVLFLFLVLVYLNKHTHTHAHTHTHTHTHTNGQMTAAKSSEARAVGEKDSGRHLDATTQRDKAVSDIYAPFWEYAGKVLKDRYVLMTWGRGGGFETCMHAGGGVSLYAGG